MKTLLTICIALLSFTIHAQNLNGAYYEGNDSISFNEDKVFFSIKDNGSLGIEFTGEGAYEMLDDYILIYTDKYSGEKTRVNTKQSEKKDTIQLQLFDEHGYSLKGIRAEFLNKSNKPIEIRITNENGIIEYKPNSKTASVKVADLLYDKVIIDFEPDMDYTVHLIKKRILEHKTVVLKLLDNNEEELTLKVLSTDYNRKNPSISHLNRLNKRAERTIDRARVFEKQLF